MNIQVRWTGHQNTVLSMFESLRSNESFVDVTLACEGKFIRCHQMVLAACSSYFQELLSLEKKKHPIIYLKDVKYSHMNALVAHMYRGEFNICHDELSALMVVADSLKICGIRETLTYESLLSDSTSLTVFPHSDFATLPSLPVTHASPASVFQSHPGDLITPPSYQPPFAIETPQSNVQSSFSEEQGHSVPLTTFYNELLHNSEMQELLAGRITECLDSATPRDEAQVAKAVSSVAEKEIDNFFNDFFSIDFGVSNSHHGEIKDEDEDPLSVAESKVDESGSTTALTTIGIPGESHQNNIINPSSVLTPTSMVSINIAPSTPGISDFVGVGNMRTVITVIDDEFRKLKAEPGVTKQQLSNSFATLQQQVSAPEPKPRAKRSKTNYKKPQFLSVVPSDPSLPYLTTLIHPWRKLGRRSINPKIPGSEIFNVRTVTKKLRAHDDVLIVPPVTPISVPRTKPTSVPPVIPISVPLITPTLVPPVTPVSVTPITPISTLPVTPISVSSVTPTWVPPIKLIPVPPTTLTLVPPIKLTSAFSIVPTMGPPAVSTLVSRTTPISAPRTIPIPISPTTPISFPPTTPISVSRTTPILISPTTPISVCRTTPVSMLHITPISAPLIAPISVTPTTPILLPPITLPSISPSPVTNYNSTSTTSPTDRGAVAISNTRQVISVPPKQGPCGGSSTKQKSVLLSLLRSAKRLGDAKLIPKPFESLEKPNIQDDVYLLKKKSFSTPRKTNNHVRNLQFKTPPSLSLPTDSENDNKNFSSSKKRKLDVVFDEKQSRKKLDWSVGKCFETKLTKIPELAEQNLSFVSFDAFNFPRTKSPVPLLPLQKWIPPPTPRIISADEQVPGWNSPVLFEKRSPETLLKLARFMSPLLPGALPRTPGHTTPVFGDRMAGYSFGSYNSPIAISNNTRPPPMAVDTELNTPNAKLNFNSVELTFVEPPSVRSNVAEPLLQSIELPTPPIILVPKSENSLPASLDMPQVKVEREKQWEQVEFEAPSIIQKFQSVAQKPVKTQRRRQTKSKKIEPPLPLVTNIDLNLLKVKLSNSSNVKLKEARQWTPKTKSKLIKVAESTRVLRSQTKGPTVNPSEKASVTLQKSSTSEVDKISDTLPVFPILAIQKFSLPFPKIGFGFRPVKDHTPVVRFKVGGKSKFLSISQRTTLSPLFREFERTLSSTGDPETQRQPNLSLINKNLILDNLLSNGTESKIELPDVSDLSTLTFEQHLSQLFPTRKF